MQSSAAVTVHHVSSCHPPSVDPFVLSFLHPSASSSRIIKLISTGHDKRIHSPQVRHRSLHPLVEPDSQHGSLVTQRNSLLLLLVFEGG